jgi:hypothetical protein
LGTSSGAGDDLSMTVRRARLLLIALAMLALLAGLWAGLVRIGWELPPLQPALPFAHGPLMISGFVGTLISLERALALGHPIAYAVPLMSGLGGLALLLGVPAPAAPMLMALGSAGLVALFASVFKRQPSPFTGLLGAGALAWFFTARVAPGSRVSHHTAPAPGASRPALGRGLRRQPARPGYNPRPHRAAPTSERGRGTERARSRAVPRAGA